jgi:hypothetical protein
MTAMRNFEKILAAKASRREVSRPITVAEGEPSGCQLYRCYAEDGCLLYVGISYDAMHRLHGGHRLSGSWFRELATVRVEHFPTREEAVAAEKAAIGREAPLYNVTVPRGGTARKVSLLTDDV